MEDRGKVLVDVGRDWLPLAQREHVRLGTEKMRGQTRQEREKERENPVCEFVENRVGKHVAKSRLGQKAHKFFVIVL